MAERDLGHPGDGPPGTTIGRGTTTPGGAPGSGALAGVVIGVVAVAALSVGREVLIPFVLAVLLSFVLSPLAAALRRLHCGRALSATLPVVLAVAIMLLTSAVIGTQIAALVARVPQYQTTISAKVGTLEQLTGKVLPARFNALIQRFENLGTPAGPVPRAPPQPKNQSPQPVPVVITHSSTASAFQIAQRVVTPVLGPLAQFGIVLVVAVFILIQKEDLRDRLIRLLGAGDMYRATAAIDEAGRRLSRYFLTQLGVNCSFGVIIGAGLFLIGVPSPVLWGVMAALLRFVPYVGSYIAAVLPVLLAAAVGEGWSMALWTAGLFIATELVIANVFEPMLYSRSTGLSPLAVIVAALFWTWLWGPIGLVLSTPITLSLAALGRHVEGLAFLDMLLGEGPALTPVESFYQRLLADDPDEAEENAERFLESRSVGEYFDAVMREGLRIASRDAARGVLTPGQITRIRHVAMDLVRAPGVGGGAPPALPAAEAEETGEDEGQTAGRTPPSARHPGAVLCIAGRGPFDEVAAAMLSVLLERRGIEGRVVPFEAVTRARIAELDVRGAAMAAVLSFDLAGNPPTLRVLIRRIRERLGGMPVLAGLWPAGDPFLADAAARQALGATWCVSTFGEAREAVLTAMRDDAAANRAPGQAVAIA